MAGHVPLASFSPFGLGTVGLLGPGKQNVGVMVARAESGPPMLFIAIIILDFWEGIR